MAVSPHIENITVPVQANFKLYSSLINASVQVGLMTAPNDMSTFTNIQTVTLQQSNAWIDYEVMFNQNIGTVGYIAFRTSGMQSLFIDDFTVSESNLCKVLSNLYTSNVTSSSVQIDWTSTGNAQEWFVKYGAEGFTTDEGIIEVVGNHPYTLIGLNPETDYEFHISSLCSANDTSSWSYRFTTEAEIVIEDTCLTPTQLTVNNLTPSSVTLTWTPQNEEAQWNGGIKKSSEIEYTYYQSNINSYTFIQLDDSCTYDIQVIAVCSENLNSAPAIPPLPLYMTAFNNICLSNL